MPTNPWSIRLAALALVVSACGGSTVDTSETYTSDAFGFSIDVPTDFRTLDQTEPDLPGLLATTDLSENAQMVVAGTLSSPPSGFLLWAFDFGAGDETFIPNLNVVRQPREPGQDADFFRGTIIDDYNSSVGAEILGVEDFSVPTGNSLLVEALFPISGADETSHAFQLITFTDDFSYTITYSFIDPGDVERQLALRSFESFMADR